MSVLRTIWRDERYLRSLAVALSAVAIYGLGLSYVWHWTLDDAGISYAYARHLLDGWGLVAVPGGLNVEAYSNFLWVGLLAFTGIFVAIPTAAKWLGAALGLVALFTGIRVVQHLEARAWWDLRIVDLTPAVMLSLAAGFIIWVPSGMENALYVALLMALVLFDLRERRDAEHFPVTGLLAAAIAVTRPEGLLYVGIAGIFKINDAVRRPAHRPQLLQFVAAAVLPLAVYHIWHYQWFGRPFPNTYYAKSPGVDAEAVAAGWSYLKEQLFAEDWLYLTPVAAFGVIQFRRRSRMLVAILVVTTAFILVSGGDWSGYGRFVSYGVPAFVTLVHLGIARLVAAMAEAAGSSHRRLGIVESALACGAVAAIAVYWGPQREDRLQSIHETKWCHFCKRSRDARTLQHLQRRFDQPVASVLTHDFGGFAWESTRSFHPIDFLGLADPTEARIRTLKDRRGKAEAHRHRLQYVFHEWPTAPTFLYFPGHWWEQLEAEAEYRDGYIPIREEIDYPFHETMWVAAHRSAWIDYFPDLDDLSSRGRIEDIRLWEATVDARPEPGGRVEIAWTVAPIRDRPVDDEVRWKVRFTGEAAKAESEAIELFPDHPAFGDHWRAGEPVTRRRTFEVPAEVGGEVRVELGMRIGDEWRWTQMESASSETVSTRLDRRFPDNLPPATSSRMQSLRARTDNLVRRRREARDMTITSPILADELAKFGDQLAASEKGRQAYLAYVLALQVDRGRSAELAPKIWRHRPTTTNVNFRLELELLRRLYRTGDLLWALRLGEWYASHGDRPGATYVADGLAGGRAEAERPEAFDRRLDRLQRVLDEEVAQSLPSPVEEAGIGGGFESETLGEWTHRGEAFGGAPHRSLSDHWPVVRGHRGDQFVSSWRPEGRAGTGRLVSPRFELESPVLAFLVGGSDSEDVAVELLVGGKVVRETRGANSTNLRPVFWNVDAWKGAEARIRIVDESEDGYILADWFVGVN